jgi:acyl-CoA dehydrogenase
MFGLLRELGLFTLPFPPEYGGSASLVSACLAIEEFGRVCCNTAYCCCCNWCRSARSLPAATMRRSAGF